MASFPYFILFQFKVERETSSTELISLRREHFKHRLGVGYHFKGDIVESWCCHSFKLYDMMWVAIWQDAVLGSMDVKEKCAWTFILTHQIHCHSTEEKITTVGTGNYNKKEDKNFNI